MALSTDQADADGLLAPNARAVDHQVDELREWDAARLVCTRNFTTRADFRRLGDVLPRRSQRARNRVRPGFGPRLRPHSCTAAQQPDETTASLVVLTVRGLPCSPC